MALKPLDIPAGFHGNGTDLEESGKWLDGSLVRWLDGSLRPVGGWRVRVENVTHSTVRGMHSWQALDSTGWMALGSYRELKAVNAGGSIYDITPDDLVEGREDGEQGTGYGNGFYGKGIFGVPIAQSSDSIPLPATTWDLDNFGEILIGCSVDDGVLWEWDLTTSGGSQLVSTSDFATDTDWIKNNGGISNSTSNWSISGGVAIYQHLTKLFDADDDTVVDATTDTINITAHGFGDGDEVTYTVPAAPASAIGGLVDGTNYFVVGSTANTIQLAATSGGAAINLTPNNSLTFDGDDSAVVDTAADKIVEANTFTSGDYITYDNGGGTDIGGLTNGANYYIVNATASEFQLSLTSGGAAIDLTPDYNITFDGDDAAIVDVANDKIVVANTFTDGDEVTYTNGGGVDIGGLTDSTNYFIINASATEFQLSATAGGAAITLTANNSVTVDAEDAAVVDVATDVITIANTFTDGEIVTYDNGGGTDIVGLVNGNDYFIISASATDFQVSLTAGGAAVVLTALGTGTAHVFRQDIGSSHNLEEDIGSAHEVRVDIGADHEFARVNYGNLEQTVSGLENASNKQDTHDLSVRMIDLVDVDGAPVTAPDANIKVTGTTSTTVLVDEPLKAGDNKFRFGTDDTEVKIEIVPNAYNTSDFHVDNVTLQNRTVAEPIQNAPTDNLGVLVTEERFIFALGSSGNSRKISWCDRENRTLWTPASTNEAGDIELQTSGQIMCGIRGRGSLVVLTDTDCHQATYIGPPYVYSFQRVGTHCGAVSRKSAVSTDKGVFWYGQENFFMFDGNSVQVLPCDVHDYVFTDFNTSQQSKVWGMVNGTHQEVWWFYPSSGSTECDRYVAYDFMEGHWLVGSLSRTSGVSRGVFTYPIMAGRNNPATTDYNVTVVSDGGDKFKISQLTGSAPELSLLRGNTYVFDVSDASNSGHLLEFKTSDHLSYTSGVTVSGTAGTAGAKVTFVVPSNAPDFLRYYCSVDGNDLGNIISVSSDSQLYDHEVGHNYDGAIVFAETGPLLTGVGDMISKVTKVIPDEKTQGDVNMTFKTRFHPNDTETSHGPFDPSNPTSVRFSGRQFRMRVEQDQAVDWRVGTMRVETTSGGRR